MKVRGVQLPAAPEESDADTPPGDYSGLEVIYRERDDLLAEGLEEDHLSEVGSDSEEGDDSNVDPAEEEPVAVEENPPQAVPVGGEPPPPKKNTGAWFHHHQFTPITPEHKIRVVDICFWLAQWKSQNRVSNTAMNQLCELIHFLLLPRDNMVPPSYHLLRCALGVPEPEDSVRHVCDVCWTLYPPLSPEQLKGNKDQVCGVRGCMRTRFRTGSSDQVVPRRRVWYFGERETLTDLLGKDGILAAMLSHRKETWNNPNGYWASPAGKHLNNRCRGLISNTDLSEEIVVAVTAGMCSPGTRSAVASEVEITPGDSIARYHSRFTRGSLVQVAMAGRCSITSRMGLSYGG